MSLPLNQVVLGDCVEVMAGWPENSVDCVVTDPPYGISFMGKKWDQALPPKKAFKEMIRVLKPGALAFIMSSPRQDVLWRMLSMLEGVGFQLKTSAIFWIYKSGFPKALDVSKGIDKKEGVLKERKLIGYEKFNLRDKRAYSQKSEMGYHGGDKGGFREITEPSSELAKEWSGWKSQTGLKPAAECILMVNKPRSEKTIVDNVLRWGTGAINVDACRIPFNQGDIGERPPRSPTGHVGGWKDWSKSSFAESVKGRFPANLLISNGALDTGETTGGGKYSLASANRKTTIFPPEEGWNKHSMTRDKQLAPDNYGDSGSPYRFFDLDAWAEHHGFLDVAKPSKAERDFGLNTQPLQVPKSKFNLSDGSKDMRFDGVIPTPRRNIHPTCKPVKLMAYLIELGCPPKGIVVDPFVGSGTTCIAAKRLRRRWIGIEINPEYVEIARARIDIKGPLDKYMEVEK